MAAMELPYGNPPLPHEVDDDDVDFLTRSLTCKSVLRSSTPSFAQTLAAELRDLQERLVRAHQLYTSRARGHPMSPSPTAAVTMPLKMEKASTGELSPPCGSIPPRRRPSLSVPDFDDMPPVTHVASHGSGKSPMSPKRSIRSNDHSDNSRNITAKLAQEAKKVSSNLEAQIRTEEHLALTAQFELREDWRKDEGQLLDLKKKSLTSKANTTQHFAGKPGVSFLTASELPPRKLFNAGESNDLSKYRFILRPASKPRVGWDVLAVMMLMYDMITLPLAVFYYEEQAAYVLFLMQLVVTLYWLLDVPATFMTAVYVNNSLYVRPWDIARAYATSWLFVDITILVPDIFVLAIFITTQASNDASSVNKNSLGMARAMRGGRVLRLLRFLRLLRIVKLLKVLDGLKARVNNGFLLLAFNIGRFVFITGYMLHLLACLWFIVGIEEGAWADLEGLQNVHASVQYQRSLEFALARVHPSMMRENMELTTATERGLAVLACFGALGFSTLFISSITNTMADVERQRQRQNQLLKSVREYCGSHYISATHAMKIKRYVEREQQRKKTQHSHLELLETLPQDMLKDLFHEARSPCLEYHDLFDNLGRKNPAMELELCCKAISEHYMLASDKIFKTGEASTTMYIVSTGRCVYCLESVSSEPTARGIYSNSRPSGAGSLVDFMNGARNGIKMLTKLRVLQDGHQMGQGDCISEHSLWIEGWTHRGKLEAVSDGWLLAMNLQELFTVVHAYPTCLVDLVIYSQFFVEALNRDFIDGTPVTDLALNDLEDDGDSVGKQPNVDGMGLISITPAEEAFAAS